MEVARELWRELAENRPNRHVMVRLGLLRLLVEMERGWLSPRHPRGEPGPEASPLRRVRPALNLANRVAGRAPAPRQAAAACGLGLTTFNILFRETIGISFGRFCMRVRIGYVARRLATSDLPVEAIAGEAGFVDASHLHRNFVKYLHMTPAAYRQHREVSPHVALAQAMGSLLLPLDIDVPEGQS
jgi:transcriptional regulator GlxA family with amidase domain